MGESTAAFEPTAWLQAQLGPPRYPFDFGNTDVERAVLWAFLLLCWVLIARRVVLRQLAPNALGHFVLSHAWMGFATADVQMLYMLIADIGGAEMVIASANVSPKRGFVMLGLVTVWWLGLCVYLWPRDKVDGLL